MYGTIGSNSIIIASVSDITFDIVLLSKPEVVKYIYILAVTHFRI